MTPIDWADLERMEAAPPDAEVQNMITAPALRQLVAAVLDQEEATERGHFHDNPRKLTATCDGCIDRRKEDQLIASLSELGDVELVDACINAGEIDNSEQHFQRLTQALATETRRRGWHGADDDGAITHHVGTDRSSA